MKTILSSANPQGYPGLLVCFLYYNPWTGGYNSPDKTFFVDDRLFFIRFCRDIIKIADKQSEKYWGKYFG